MQDLKELSYVDVSPDRGECVFFECFATASKRNSTRWTGISNNLGNGTEDFVDFEDTVHAWLCRQAVANPSRKHPPIPRPSAQEMLYSDRSQKIQQDCVRV